MKTILVDDEMWMLQQFKDECTNIQDIELIGQFQTAMDALEFAKKQRVDLAFLDIEMPGMNGLDLSDKLRELYPDIVIIFVSAYDKYMLDAFHKRGADYFVLKPYSKDDIQRVLERAKLLGERQKKRIYIHTFGRFNVFVDGKPVSFKSKKAKELLALVVNKRGDTISNEEAYATLWEDRPFGNDEMTVYRMALHRLRTTLDKAGIGNMLISMPHEQKLNTDIVDCDYYQFLEGDVEAIRQFHNEYMSEYSWSEPTLSELLRRQQEFEQSAKRK